MTAHQAWVHRRERIVVCTADGVSHLRGRQTVGRPTQVAELRVIPETARLLITIVVELTVQVKVAGDASVFPAKSIAMTSKVWVPSATPL